MQRRPHKQYTDDRSALCDARRPTPTILPNGIHPVRAKAILSNKKKWVNGTIIHYKFHEDEQSVWSDEQKEKVHWAFDIWKRKGIGLKFAETADSTKAEVRIGFDQNDGSWSWIGTDVLKNDDRGRNMNFGWSLLTAWGQATALHEIGHLLGMFHEHKSSNSGIEWSEKVFEYFATPPNFWKHDEMFRNIIQPLDEGETNGPDWDPFSIMHHTVESGLISTPADWRDGTPENLTLSVQDIAWARAAYPDKQLIKSIGLMDLRSLQASAGAQSDFLFSPPATREYSIKTVGQSDCKIVVFIEKDGEPRHLAAEDDSGHDSNAEIVATLVKSKRYIIRVRTHFTDQNTRLSLLIS